MKKIEILFLDVDGTLTQGDITYTQGGEEIKTFNIKDGLGLSVWNKNLGRKSVIISGRECELVRRRAGELGVFATYLGISDKGKIINEVLASLNLKPTQAACIGDDLNDLSMFRILKNSYAPKDCASGIKNEVKTLLSKNGGKGAVREMIEDILRKEGGSSELKKHFN